MKKHLIPILFCALISAAFAAEYNPPPASDSARLRAWSKLGTDPLSLPGALKLSGETNEITVAGGKMLLDGAPITLWTNDTPNLTATHLATNTVLHFKTDDPTALSFLYNETWPGNVGPSLEFSGGTTDETNVFTGFRMGSYGLVHNTLFALDTFNDGAGAEQLRFYMQTDGALGEILLLVNDGPASSSKIQLSNDGDATVNISADGVIAGISVIATNGFRTLAATNQVAFGATNTAPTVTTNVAKWISVQVSGFTNAYRLPLYE